MKYWHPHLPFGQHFSVFVIDTIMHDFCLNKIGISYLMIILCFQRSQFYCIAWSIRCILLYAKVTIIVPWFFMCLINDWYLVSSYRFCFTFKVPYLHLLWPGWLNELGSWITFILLLIIGMQILQVLINEGNLIWFDLIFGV
jgi:hypothetical protein